MKTVWRRKQGGKRSRYYTGRYTIEDGKPVDVALRLTDKRAAEAKLEEIMQEAEREKYKLIPKKSYRDAAEARLGLLVTEYAADLTAQGRSKAHVHDTTKRVRTILAGCGWNYIGDITPPSFTKWRAKNTISPRTGKPYAPKTVKEFQVSLNAFLNWLVAQEYIERNPLENVAKPETRGKQTRPKRSATLDELGLIFEHAANEEHSIAYQLLSYTGQRCKEIESLVLGRVFLDGEIPYISIIESTTKDKKKRDIPLHPRLAEAVKSYVAKKGITAADAPLFTDFPDLKAFNATLERAGIPRVDAQGFVLNRHALRMTFQTMGVRAGINQRAAQEILGHTDANLTANSYTYARALELNREVLKLSYPGEKIATKIATETVTKTVKSRAIADILGELLITLQNPDSQGELSTITAATLSKTMVDATGLEPVTPCV